ncbi:MAG: DUF4339 domain-containing protein [Synergistaceae bacterium]|jgi:hypothetical protein|nr:DUF4339 domain-containing protein [Synergistaceae bacterium]
MKKWYCVINGQTFGPYSKDQLKAKAEKGTITPDTLVQDAGSGECGLIWIKACETEINDVFPKYTSVSDNSQKPVNSGRREEDNKSDVKNIMILQMLKESKELRLLLIVLVPMVLLMLMWLMAEHMILVIGLIVILVLYSTMAMILRHRRLKRQQDIDILNADIGKMGGDEAERRAEKYRNR